MGIGRELALILAKHKPILLILDILPLPEELNQKLTALGATVHYYHIDLTNTDLIEQVKKFENFLIFTEFQLSKKRTRNHLYLYKQRWSSRG